MLFLVNKMTGAAVAMLDFAPSVNECDGHGVLQWTGILSSMHSHLIILPGVVCDCDQDRAFSQKISE